MKLFGTHSGRHGPPFRVESENFRVGRMEEIIWFEVGPEAQRMKHLPKAAWLVYGRAEAGSGDLTDGRVVLSAGRAPRFLLLSPLPSLLTYWYP